MKNYASRISLALIILTPVGCVRSVNPIGSEEDLIFDANIVGIWGWENSDEIYQVTGDGDGGYTLVHTDEECDKGTFEMYLTELEGNRFLNIYPEEPEEYDNEFYNSLLIRAFLIARIEIDGPAANVWLMDTDWLEKYLESNSKGVDHAALDESLLTGSTDQIQDFYLAHLDTPGAFGDGLEPMVRLSQERVEEIRIACRPKFPGGTWWSF